MINALTPLDWVFAAILLVSLLLGAWRGLVYETASLLGWIAAFVLAYWLGPEVGGWLPMGGASAPLRHAAGFALVFIAVAFGGGFVAWLARRLVGKLGLRPVDRMLGAVFGLLRGAIVLLGLAVVVQLTPLRSEGWWRQAQATPLLLETLALLRPALPPELGQYLPQSGRS